MQGLTHDIRHAAHSLIRSPFLTGIIVLMLAFGIGSSAAIFSTVYGLIIRPLPFPDADRLVEVWRQSEQSSFRVTPTPAEARLWKSRVTAFEQLEPWAITTMTLTGRGDAARLTVARISSTFPRLIGMAPVLGRAFTPTEASGGGAKVAVLSYGLWRTRFGGAGDVLGKTVTLAGQPYTIVGVAPREFGPPSLLSDRPDAFVPLVLTDDTRGLRVAAKLRPGVTLAAATAQLAALAPDDPNAKDAGMSWTGEVVRPNEFLASRLKDGVVLLMGAVSLLLLIACMNVANLLLGRMQLRRRETAVRSALGATRGRLVRQMLAESLLLACAGGALGVLVAVWALDLMRVLRPDTLDVLDRVSLNGPVLLFTLAVSTLTGMVFGLVPALQGSSGRALESLRSGRRAGEAGVFGRRFRLGLVAAEVALSFALLVGAGLLVRTVARLNDVDVGFQPGGLVAAFVQLPAWKYGDAAAREAYYQDLARRVRALPGVDAVALGGGVPPQSGVDFGAGLEVEGGQPPGPDAPRTYFGNPAGPDYFATLRQQVVAGRPFTPQEVRDDAPVWILGRTLARSLFGDVASAVGRHVRFVGGKRWNTVVGVAADVRLNGLSVTQDRLQLYEPMHPSADRVLIVRTSAPPATMAAVRRLASQLDADVPIDRITTVSAMMQASMARQRFIMVLLAVFAAVAAGLAAVGLYGVLTHLVARRRREIGIRMSLGAQPGGILRMVVRQGVVATALGLTAGLAIALLAVRLVSSQLYGIGRFDPPTYLATALLLALVALLATYLPARRAASVDPVETMRAE